MALVVGGVIVTGTQTLDASKLTGTASAINGSNITNLPAPSSANVGTASAGLSAGAVGTYAMGYGVNYSGGFNPTAGTTTTNFRYNNVNGNSTSSGNASGTWRAHGSVASGNDQERTTVWLRIS